MTTRQCERDGCDNDIAAGARSHAKYCGKSCRVMASRARKNDTAARAQFLDTQRERLVSKPDNLPETATYLTEESPVSPQVFPASLTRLPRWIRRAADKTPLTISNDVAQSNNEATWSTFSAASGSTVGTGLGFVLSGDGVICVDLDHVITDGVLSDEAETFLSSLPPTYIEISPSGDGLHVWGTGLVLTSRKFRNSTMAGEVIGARKYVTMTGNRFRGAPLSLANIAGQAAPLIY